MAVSRRTALPYPAPAGLSGGDDDTATGVTITADVVAAETGITEERAGRLLDVAAELVGRYAPDAPAALLNEACIRFCGYLGQSGYGAVRSETVGPMSVEYQMNHSAAFRNSGAAALLTGYKVRRAGPIG